MVDPDVEEAATAAVGGGDETYSVNDEEADKGYDTTNPSTAASTIGTDELLPFAADDDEAGTGTAAAAVGVGTVWCWYCYWYCCCFSYRL